MARGKVLFLSQWFDPEPAAMKGLAFVRALIDQGFEVEVATGFPNYPTGKIAPGYTLKPYTRQIMDGVVVHRLWLYPSHDHSSLGRALNYMSFGVTATLFCLLRARRYDAVYVYHPPITTGLAAAVSGWFTRRRFVLEVQDLWPDSVTVTGMPGASRLGPILDPVCRFTWRAAAMVIAQSKGMADRLAERGVPRDRLTAVYNWADEANARPRGEADLTPYGFDQAFNFVFGGNLGAVQGLDVVIRAADLAARRDPRIRLILIGDGVERERLQALVRSIDATNVSIHPGVPQTAIGDIFAAADALVIHLDDNPLFEITVPSKTQFYLAMGRPILVCVNGEARRLVETAGAGVAAPPGDVEAIADAMVRMAALPVQTLADMGRAGRAAYLSHFSAAAGVAATAACLDRVIAGR